VALAAWLGVGGMATLLYAPGTAWDGVGVAAAAGGAAAMALEHVLNHANNIRQVR
jgi:probable blue pigment (indigoidine) exporter